MKDDPLSQAVELRAKGEPFVLATVVACRRPTSAYVGAKAIIGGDGGFSGWVGGSCAQPIVVREALKALEDGSPRLLRISPDPPPDDQAPEGVPYSDMPCQSQGALEVSIEPFYPRPRLRIVGETPLAHARRRAGTRAGSPGRRTSKRMFGGRFPSPAWKTFATGKPDRSHVS